MRAVVPNEQGDYVALARTKKGRLFKKQILKRGPLRHPESGRVIDITDDVIGSMVKNFKDGVCDIVQFPMAGPNNEHVEEPEKNAGEVIALEDDGTSLYAVIDVRKPNLMDEIGSTVLGASAYLDLNYTDTRTGEPAGPTLLHVCATNRPYVVGLEDYSEVLAMTDVSDGETILLVQPEEAQTMTLDELLAELKDTHGVDVASLQAKVAEAEKTTAALTAKLSESGAVKLTNTGEAFTANDMINAVGQLAKETVQLTSTVAQLQKDAEAAKREAAVAEIDTLVAATRITPAEKDDFLELRLTNPGMFNRMVANRPAALPAPSGVDTADKAEKIDLDAYAEALVGRL